MVTKLNRYKFLETFTKITFVFAINWIVVFLLGYLIIFYMREKQIYFSGVPEMYLLLFFFYFVSYKVAEYLNKKFFKIRKSNFVALEIIAFVSISYALIKLFLYALGKSSWFF